MNLIRPGYMLSFASVIIASSLVIYPSFVVVVDDVSGFIALVTFFFGLVVFVTRKSQILPFSRTEKVFFLALTSLSVSAIFTSIYSSSDFASANRFTNFVLAIPIYIFFKNNSIDEKYIWSGLAAGATITLGVAVYQRFGLLLPRAHGSVNPILFGDVGLIMGCMSLAGIGWFRQQNRWMIVIPFIAFASGLVASALSLSRGGWVALPFLGLLLIWYSVQKISIKKMFFFLSLFIFVLGLSYLIPQTGIQSRVAIATEQIDQYFSSDTNPNDPARKTSVGVRLEMWKAAWLIFVDHPLAGVGWGNYRTETNKLFEQGLISVESAKFYHAHNQFFSTLAKGGVLGFLALSILFLFPLFVFYSHSRKKAPDCTDRIALAGMILVVGFACFSLTEAIFERSRTIIFYAFYLSVFMAMILKDKKPSVIDPTIS